MNADAMFRQVDDEIGCDVAKRLYTKLFRGEGEMVDFGSVPYILDEVVERLRKRGYPASVLATFIHVGV